MCGVPTTCAEPKWGGACWRYAALKKTKNSTVLLHTLNQNIRLYPAQKLYDNVMVSRYESALNNNKIYLHVEENTNLNLNLNQYRAPAHISHVIKIIHLYIQVHPSNSACTKWLLGRLLLLCQLHRCEHH